MDGFILVGGQSRRMGQDKAEMLLAGVAMVQRQVETLSAVCRSVRLVGNREDLRRFAPVVPEGRSEAGPIAGLEAGLLAAVYEWTLFVPVDVPGVPASLLRAWAGAVSGAGDRKVRISYLRAQGQHQPVFCMLHRCCAGLLPRAINKAGLPLRLVLAALAEQIGPESLWVADAEAFGGNVAPATLATWFRNINTPEEHHALEREMLQRRSAGSKERNVGDGRE